MKSLLFLTLFNSLAQSRIYFSETFSDNDGWQNRWIQSTNVDTYGKFERNNGLFHGDYEEAYGLRTSQDAKFYAIASKFNQTFDNKDKDLVVQFTVKHEQNIDCGGGYAKILSSKENLSKFSGDTTYFLMFGPDICGSSRKVHVIITYKGENKLIKHEINAPSDELTHQYTLVIKPNQQIPDPEKKKPSNWADEKEIIDPNDKKPEGWDDIPQTIQDVNAVKPEDWDEELDGEWEPPQIPNPEYKGEWQPRRIPNPDYKGPWVQPMIDNPDFIPDEEIYRFSDMGAIGLDLWQVKSGSIFDNFIVTDSIEEAHEFGKNHWEKYKNAEKKAKEQLDEENRKKQAESAPQQDASEAEVGEEIGEDIIDEHEEL
ncbi:Calreticulin domain-containing protein [Rozella allomycis CSF55]|uniref:Calreticulin n=1 Tax=Rozella allomycis (strain CSF55) TaxID=988480 RepID=A0A075AQ37_ROZAC|nr:Calreticulin domain-containing protein [Rozella allomycis CSF55]|eukprot:EPZ32318.1 Calreticulin domain-containing protein [Rozella allomycis CSF55]